MDLRIYLYVCCVCVRMLANLAIFCAAFVDTNRPSAWWMLQSCIIHIYIYIYRIWIILEALWCLLTHNMGIQKDAEIHRNRFRNSFHSRPSLNSNARIARSLCAIVFHHRMKFSGPLLIKYRSIQSHRPRHHIHKHSSGSDNGRVLKQKSIKCWNLHDFFTICVFVCALCGMHSTAKKMNHMSYFSNYVSNELFNYCDNLDFIIHIVR